MIEQRDRLIRCFSAVFPKLAAEDIPKAGIETVDDWDSLASVRLIAVVEEEFGIRIGLQDLQELTTFLAFEQQLSK